MSSIINSSLLSERCIVVGAVFADSLQAIRACGKLLAEAGYVQPDYIDAMIERERVSTTYIGNGVAVPHGTITSRRFINSTGLALIQVPGGVDFGNGNIARLLVGLAAKDDDHIDLLADIAVICADDERLGGLLSAGSASEMLDVIASARNR